MKIGKCITLLAFLANVLYLVPNLESSPLCTCNHNSSQEVHTSHSDNKIRDCHNAEKAKVHICVCKRSKKNTANAITFKPILIVVSSFELAQPDESSYFLSNFEYKIYNIYTDPILKPPKSINA